MCIYTEYSHPLRSVVVFLLLSLLLNTSLLSDFFFPNVRSIDWAHSIFLHCYAMWLLLFFRWSLLVLSLILLWLLFSIYLLLNVILYWNPFIQFQSIKRVFFLYFDVRIQCPITALTGGLSHFCSRRLSRIKAVWDGVRNVRMNNWNKSNNINNNSHSEQRI